MPNVLEADPEVCRAVRQFQTMLTKERRSSPRRPFPFVRRIARATGRKVPEEATFFSVKCRDLSTQGFSFLVKARPQFTSLVLALDAWPSPIYVAAEVKHCEDVLIYPSGRTEVLHDRGARVDAERSSDDGVESWVLVGCKFTQRLAEPESQGPQIE